MKNLVRYISVCCMLFICGCESDFFDQVPDDRMTIDEVFKRRVESEQYLANVYNYLRDESDQSLSQGSPWMGLSDEGDVTYANHHTYSMNLGNWNSSHNYYNFWSHYYAGIRAATYFIQRIDENTEILNSEGGPDLIRQYKAEARALRAEFYAALLKQYGPVILLPTQEVISPDAPNDVIELPRNTYDECVDFIAAEFDGAAADLEEWYTNPMDYGRMNRVVCMAYKARMLLYAASPLWNGNQEFEGFVNADGRQLVSLSYSAEKWKRAADAARNIIDLDRFSLYKEFDNDGNIEPINSYQNVLLEPWNSEIIFSRKSPNIRAWEWRSTPRFAGGTAGNGPTQQLVDAYQMSNGERPILGYNADGTPMINSRSGYVEEGFSDEASTHTDAGTWNMYVDREPRFYATIGFNGGYWVNRTNFPAKIGLYNTGNTGLRGAGNNFSRTGYLTKRNVHPRSNYTTANASIDRPLVFIRFAEILLSYIEALNEHSPGHPDIARYLNAIRERAGIPPLPVTLSPEELRERILLERRLELAFERHRYFDSRRWKIAPQTAGGVFYGMDIDAGTSLSDPAFFKRVVFERRIFESPKHYLFPIPLSEIERNRQLTQNPGW